MGCEVRHEGIVAQILLQSFIDLGHESSVAVNELLQRLFPEGEVSGDVESEVMLEFSKDGGELGDIVRYFGHRYISMMQCTL